MAYGPFGKHFARFWRESVLGEFPDEPYQPAPVEAANEGVSQYGLHNILRYDQYDTRTGLFINDGSLGFCLEVVPQSGADDTMATRLASIFNPIPPGYGLQWCLFGSPMLHDAQQAYLDLRARAAETGEGSALSEALARRRVAFIRGAQGKPLWATDNYSVRTLRLVLSITKAGSADDSHLVSELCMLRETLRAALRTASLPNAPMNAEDLLNFLDPILNPQRMFDTTHPPERVYDEGRSLKDQITTFGQHVRVNPDELLFGLPPQSRDEPDERIAVRSFGVVQYPRRKELWEMANIIGSYFDDTLQYPCPFLVCSGVFTLDRAAVETRAQIKAARAKQNATSKMAEYQPELQAQAQDWNIVMHQLDNRGTLCELYHTLVLFAPRAQIARASQVAVNIWRDGNFVIAPLRMLQLSMLYCCLPMTFTANVRDDLKRFRVLSTKTTTNAVAMAPVIGEWAGIGAPIMMFWGRRGQAIHLDFFANPQGNKNFFIAGVSGSGKTVTCNEIVSSYRAAGAKVWILDVGRGYQNLIRLQGGLFLEFTPSLNICINPFSWVGVDSDISFKEELRLLKPMIGRMASPNTALSEFQYSLLEEAIMGVWKDYGNDTNPTLIQQYLAQKIKNETAGIERVAYELSKQLQPFTETGAYGRYFNGRANLRLDADLIGLELEELKNAPDLRRVVLFVLTSRITHDMYLSRSRMKLCLMDEAWQLLGSDKETADFIEEGYRRARKYNGSFGLGTQSIEDAFKNDASLAAYTNADWKILLRQDPMSLHSTIESGRYTCTPGQRRVLESLATVEGRYAEMLISSPVGQSVVRHIPDPFSLLMASSKPQDYEQIRRLTEQGYSMIDALDAVLRTRATR